MAMPVTREEVESAMAPLLGSMLLQTSPMVEEVTQLLRSYAPYRQTLEELSRELNQLLIQLLRSATRGSMLIITDDYQPIRLKEEHFWQLTDDLMGVVFDKMTPFSANFIKLNDYSLRVQSLSALRVLITRYDAYYTEEELLFMIRMVRKTYPRHRYAAWLPPGG